ncbi:MAG: DUF4266 domain-containing protein [Pseudomonadales bacterium]
MPAKKNLIALLTFAALFLQGCSVQPWVKPYERARLASDLMQYDRDQVSDSYMHHVRQSREGARGAEGAGGGGCGCN